MLYIFYPNKNIHINKSQLKPGEIYIEYKDEGGYVSKEIENLYKKRKYTWLYLKVIDFLDKLADEDDLSTYFEIGNLKAIGDGIIEMRIPKTDKRGVFRIYYCDSKLQNECGAEVLLEAEYKNSDPQKINSAKSRRREYLERIKQEQKHEKD